MCLRQYIIKHHFKSVSLPHVLHSVSALTWTCYRRNHMLHRIQMISLYNCIEHQYSGHSKDRQYLFWKLGKERKATERPDWEQRQQRLYIDLPSTSYSPVWKKLIFHIKNVSWAVTDSTNVTITFQESLSYSLPVLPWSSQ